MFTVQTLTPRWHCCMKSIFRLSGWIDLYRVYFGDSVALLCVSSAFSISLDSSL